MAWGTSKTHLDTEEIKRLQTKVEELNCEDYMEEKKVEFLETSKKLDELLRRQEIYWAQRSRIQWLKHRDSNTKILPFKGVTKEKA